MLVFQELVSDLSKYQEMIETTVDMQQASQGQFVIKPDFDDTLAGKSVSSIISIESYTTYILLESTVS